MKVLITTEFFMPFICGVTTAVLNQKQVLEESGWEVRILTIGKENRSYYDDSEGVYYIRSNFPQLYKDSYATVAFHDPLLKDIYAWNPDVVHAQNEFFTFIFAKKVAKKCKTPLILTCHTDYPAYGVHFMKNQKRWNKLARKYVPRIIRDANALLCSSDKICEILTSYNVSNLILNIKLGLNLHGFHKHLGEDEKLRLRKECGIVGSGIVFLSVCRLSEEKQVDQCLYAFKEIHRRYPEASFLIVGDGTEMERLNTIASSLKLNGSVHFVGSVPYEDVWKYYQLGDLFISASESETQGLTYLEAIASGVPVIIKKNLVNNNFLKPGINGLDYDSQEDMVLKCIDLLSHPEIISKMKSLSPDSVYSFSLYGFKKNLNDLYGIALTEKWLVGEAIPSDSRAFSKFGIKS